MFGMGYMLLYKIVVAHAYQEQADGPLTCVPTAYSVDWMRRRDVLMCTVPGGIGLWCEAARCDLILEEGGIGEVLLGFRWYTCDPWFSLYTLPVAPTADSVLFLRTSSRTGVGCVHAKDSLLVDGDLFARLEHPLLARHLDRHDQLRKPVMVTELDLADVAHARDDGRTSWRISFAARVSRWKYYFFSTTRADLEGLVVIDLDGGMTFSAAEVEIFPGDRRAIVFMSERDIVMQAQYAQRFQLRERGESGERVLVTRLPNADIRKVTQDAIDGKTTLVSEIYIN